MDHWPIGELVDAFCHGKYGQKYNDRLKQSEYISEVIYSDLIEKTITYPRLVYPYEYHCDCYKRTKDTPLKGITCTNCKNPC